MLKSKKHIALFYLILFISIKLVGFHSLNHEDNDHVSDCDICEFVITANTTPFIESEEIIVEPPTTFNFNKKSTYSYHYLFTQAQVDNSLFSRPPPTV